jgi:hypothetical protein
MAAGRDSSTAVINATHQWQKRDQQAYTSLEFPVADASVQAVLRWCR